MTVKNTLSSSVADAQQSLASALADRIAAHVERLNADGCPLVTTTAALGLWSHVRRYETPESDPVAARLVMRALDLGWRPTTPETGSDPYDTPPLPLEAIADA